MGELEVTSFADGFRLLKLVCGSFGSTLELLGVAVAKVGWVVFEFDVVGGVDRDVERRWSFAFRRLLNGEEFLRLIGRLF